MSKKGELQTSAPNLSPYVLERLGEGFSDPELNQICIEMLQSAENIDQRLSALVYKPSSHDSQNRLTQEGLDSQIEDALDPDKLALATQASEIFWSLDKVEKDAENTLLTRATVSLIFTGVKNRSTSRDIHGPYLPRARRLLEFWKTNNITITADKAIDIYKSVAVPIDNVLETEKSITKTNGQSLEQIDQLISLHERIDTDVDLKLIKFLIFNSIVEGFKKPSIQAADVKLLGDGDNVKQLNESHIGHYYRAAKFFDHLKDEKSYGYKFELERLSSSHSKGRLLRIQNREFKEDFNNLSSMVYSYRIIQALESHLSEFPGKQQSLIKLREDRVQTAGTALSKEALELFNKFHNSAAKKHHDDIHLTSTDDTEVRETIWERSRDAELIKMSAAEGLFLHLKDLGIDLTTVLLKVFNWHLEPQVGRMLEGIEFEEKLRVLEPEVNSRLAEFQSIDDGYQITNKRLRDRQPTLITLAKQLQESLQEPLPDTTMRSLVGLMMGVYWERTGEKSTMAEIANQYIEDVERLRSLSTELDYLGQPQDSRLLKLTNLLDELIDVGTFDKPDKFQVFDDFILNYIIARDKAEDYLALEVEAEPEKKVSLLSETVVPVEALRQAVEEDLYVFPPSATGREVAGDYAKGIDKKYLPQIEWERIIKLVELRNKFREQKLDALLILTKQASWQVLPFFVLEVNIPNDDHSVAVVESPVWGNATYIFRESDSRREWREIVQLGRADARRLGALQTVHADSKKLDVHAFKLWNRVIKELTVLR